MAHPQIILHCETLIRYKHLDFRHDNNSIPGVLIKEIWYIITCLQNLETRNYKLYEQFLLLCIRICMCIEVLCILNVEPGDVNITDVTCNPVNMINQCTVRWNVSV